MIVAIDGPAGAGKSTVARAVAERLGYSYLDTGALYRLVALAALEAGAPLGDGDGLGALAASLDVTVDRGRYLLGGRDVTSRIREADVTEAAPTVSAHPAVREALLGLQRAAASDGDVVIEGRDIGSTVVPEAEVKVFLTASLEERASRRVRQLGLPEDDVTMAEIISSIEERDALDASRESSPLTVAAGAIHLDTTGMSLDEVVDAVVRLVEGAG